ncbi:NADH-ubiquinone oxidoreductase subunit NDUFA12 family protein [Azospirillum sp. B506]|uniref:NADH-ubiquinone oxidoreductase subunit NDUFA12 family protein n=1 Tax=Azospirillum sp. B506 TaxID=137721 RepID=UPI000349FC67
MSEPISLFTKLANIHIRYVTWRRGAKVGSDRFGNVYYRSKDTQPGTRERRWVLYAGEPDASKIPPEWHGWLHHTTKEPLPEGSSAFHKPGRRNICPTCPARSRPIVRPAMCWPAGSVCRPPAITSPGLRADPCGD